MNTHSSGYYSIDKDYNILSYNDTAKQLYPNLQPGVKCYKALMGLNSPCPPYGSEYLLHYLYAM